MHMVTSSVTMHMVTSSVTMVTSSANNTKKRLNNYLLLFVYIMVVLILKSLHF